MGCNSSKQKHRMPVGGIRGRNKSLQYGSKFKGQGAAELKKNYTINSETPLIGKGAFGKVYKTSSTADTSMVVAIKVIDKEKIRDDMEMLQTEIDVLNTLDHPNIVKYFETYNDHQYVYLVMQYVEGETLLKKLETKTGDDYSVCVSKYMQSLLGAINHCHYQELVHRDIKPDNIMVSKDDEVILIDFGVA